MTLDELLNNLPSGLLRPLGSVPGDASISRIDYDSRKAGPGSLFVAMRGEKADGHQFIPMAIGNGAAAVVGEETSALDALPCPAFVAVNARRAIAELAVALQRRPSSEMNVVGVTGTNGKTTIAHLVERLYAGLGFPTGRIGTLGVKIGDAEEEGAHTTPEAPDLQATLRRMADAGVTKVAMEASSHALAQDRTWGTLFPTVVFTNLTQDHLDYHPTMEAYYEAKRRLFAEYAPLNGAAVINVDDPFGRRLAKETPRRVLTYGLGDAQLRAHSVTPLPAGSEFRLEYNGRSAPVHMRLPGLFNVYNALAAVGALLSDGQPLDAILPALEALTGAPGRFEAVDEGQPFAVLVDYAHTPDALENILRAARKITEGRVLAVFGCGGDRDRTKRPKMGRIGVENADIAFITSDNPRTEDPLAIIDEIRAGLSGADNYTVNPDRRAAIIAAIGEAKPGDAVVIAGKGHEDYQIIGTVKHHFDDREIAREALREAIR
ncbi:MAG TPA: UDP-N-acetylmuramoyl-L-alanyl-D-glutamate--2,6-diaminopimelate ligase [Armatimonadota bacterium]|jgi:UDP-N-acetylmuramoyl-L-alanyl-D-glutamate--2,6-diaminopimelate ligase